MASALALFLPTVILGMCWSAAIPDYINVCKRSDPHVTDCIIKSALALKPKLKSGIPELNVPALEPLRIPTVEVAGPEHNGFSLYLENVDVYGASDFEIKGLELDMENQIYRIKANLPLLKLEGDCDVDAKIVSLNIKGRGKFEADAKNCAATAVLKSEIYEKDGQKYMRFTDMDLDLTLDDYTVKTSNILEDETLNETINELISQNKEELITEATPYVRNKASEIILQMANNVVSTFPLDQIFPEK